MFPLRGIGGDEATRIPQCAQVLGRVEAVGAGIAEHPRARRSQPGTVCLRGILQEQQVIFRAKRADRLDIGELAVQVDRHDDARTWRHRRGDRCRRYVERAGLHIGKTHLQPGVGDSECRRDERVGWNDHLVAGFDASQGYPGAQCQAQRIVAVCDQHAIG